MAVRIGTSVDNDWRRCSPQLEITPFNQLAGEMLALAEVIRRQVLVERLAGSVTNSALESIPQFVPRKYDFDAVSEAAKTMTAIQIYEAVKTGGDWDFKRGGRTELADFGNWNYGVIAKDWSTQFSPFADVFAEFFQELALRGAGWYQEKSGTSSPEWGSYLGSPPYGDDPADQQNIIHGWEIEQSRFDTPRSDFGDESSEIEPYDPFESDKSYQEPHSY